MRWAQVEPVLCLGWQLDDFPDLVDAVAFRHNQAGAVFELAL
jgi:hypothetical protein